MKRKTFEPEKYGAVICPCCNNHGYIQNPERQFCPKCGGFGFVKREPEENMNPLLVIGKGDDRTLKEGDIFESLLDREEYVVKSIVNNMVVLQTRKGDRQILTGIETLKTKSFYREKEKKVNQ